MTKAMPQMPQPCHRANMLSYQAFDAMCGMCGMVPAVLCIFSYGASVVLIRVKPQGMPHMAQMVTRR